MYGTPPAAFVEYEDSRGGGAVLPPWFTTYRAWLGALLLAGWPHLAYMTSRMTDGSDDPWGLVALATALVFLPWKKLGETVPVHFAWFFSACLLPLLCIASFFWLDAPLLRAAAWVLALSALLLRAGSPPAVAGLLLMSLPLMASLDFYAGYPLRWLVSHSNAILLNLIGLGVEAKGVVLQWGEKEVIVDAPCSGLRMLWFGGYLTFTVGALYRLTWRRMCFLAVFGLVLVVLANGGRSFLLFFPESEMIQMPEWVHGGLGLVIFALVAAILAQAAQRLGGVRI
jgi:exosortase/archaeosortase family protein